MVSHSHNMHQDLVLTIPRLADIYTLKFKGRTNKEYTSMGKKKAGETVNCSPIVRHKHGSLLGWTSTSRRGDEWMNRIGRKWSMVYCKPPFVWDNWGRLWKARPPVKKKKQQKSKPLSRNFPFWLNRSGAMNIQNIFGLHGLLTWFDLIQSSPMSIIFHISL
jgi:hypothetical protein